MEKVKIGSIRTPKPLNRLLQNLVWVITSAIRWYEPACQSSNRSPQWGRPGKWVKYHDRMAFSFTFFDPKFCMRPEPKSENGFLRSLIHKMLIPGCCIPTGKNCKKFPFPPFYPQNAPTARLPTVTLHCPPGKICPCDAALRQNSLTTCFEFL